MTVTEENTEKNDLERGKGMERQKCYYELSRNCKDGCDRRKTLRKNNLGMENETGTPNCGNELSRS